MQLASNALFNRPLERPAASAAYVLRGGDDDGARRLHLLARVKWPTTRALLCRAGIHRGMHCLDAGCGNGEITLQIARMVVPEGLVVGIDTDETILRRARTEVARERLRVRFEALHAADLEDESVYDLVYSYGLLSHSPEPERVVDRMVRAARPGATIIVEDIDFPGHICYPPSPAFDRYVDLYQAFIREMGGDPAIGPRLVELLHAAGVEGLHVDVAQPTFLDGEGKRVAQVTMEHIGEAVVQAGLAAHAEVSAIIVELDEIARDWRTVISLPRVFQVWGRTSPA